jgi:hypothetical protein
MKTILLGLWLLGAGANACVPGDALWSGIIGTQQTTCCARGGVRGEGNMHYVTDVLLRCRHGSHRSLFVPVYEHQRVAGQADLPPGSTTVRDPEQGVSQAVACREGPPLRRPASPFKRFRVELHHCCTLDVSSISGAFIPSTFDHGFFDSGTVTGFTGIATCRHRAIPVSLRETPGGATSARTRGETTVP